MPRTAKQNQAIRDKRKAKITAEGIKLISIYGLNNVVIDDIAKEVGCSHGLFYHYYKRIEDLYAAIPEFINESKKISSYTAKYLPVAELPAAEGLRLFAKNLEDLPSYPSLVLHTAHIVFSTRESLEFFNYLNFFKKLVIDGQASGEVKEGDPDALLDLLLDTLGGYIERVIREGSTARPIPADLFAGILLK